jgi:hypothetical protein
MKKASFFYFANRSQTRNPYSVPMRSQQHDNSGYFIKNNFTIEKYQKELPKNQAVKIPCAPTKFIKSARSNTLQKKITSLFSFRQQVTSRTTAPGSLLRIKTTNYTSLSSDIFPAQRERLYFRENRDILLTFIMKKFREEQGGGLIYLNID